MAAIATFTDAQRTAHNTHKFAFTLSPRNYGYWKAMIEPFLITNNLIGYVDGTICRPEPTVTITTAPSKEGESSSVSTAVNPSFAPWIANDAHVRMIILSTISEDSFQHVQGTTSRDLWLSLERAYAPNTASREYTLKTQLLRILMKGDETPLTYLSRAMAYASTLANIGEPMKDKDLVMLTISGLRDEYNGLKSNLLARNPPITFNELHGILSDHDFMIHKPEAGTPQLFTSTTGTTNPTQPQLQTLQQLATQLGYQVSPIAQPNSQPQAFYASRPHNNRGYRRGNSRGNYRGNYNNRGRDTRENNQSAPTRQFSWASTHNVVYGHCNRCGTGHLPSQCPNHQPPAMSSRSSPQANFANFSDTASTTTATWFPDTGANSHATPDLSNLDNSEVYQGNDSLYVGNGNPLPILHIGSSKIFSLNKTFNLSDILHVPSVTKKPFICSTVLFGQ